MSGPVERLRKAVADPHRLRVTVRADDIRKLLFAAGFEDEAPDVAAKAGSSVSALRASVMPSRSFATPTTEDRTDG